MNRHRFTLLLFPVALLFSITSCHFVNPNTNKGDYPVSLSSKVNRTAFTQGNIITISDFIVTVTLNTEEVKVTSDAKLEAGDSLYLGNIITLVDSCLPSLQKLISLELNGLIQ